MKRFIELLDFKKQPLDERSAVICCDNNLTIQQGYREALNDLKCKGKRVRFMQLLVGRTPKTAKPYLPAVSVCK